MIKKAEKLVQDFKDKLENNKDHNIDEDLKSQMDNFSMYTQSINK